MSGTGKSSALSELGRRGYRVVDTDDPGWREYREYVESPNEVRRGEWLWVEERITGLLDSDDGRSLFVQGCVRNQSKFYDRFNAVVLLSAPVDVILDRIARRTTNNYGKTPVGRAMILDDLARVEPLLRANCTHELDAKCEHLYPERLLGEFPAYPDVGERVQGTHVESIRPPSSSPGQTRLRLASARGPRMTFTNCECVSCPVWGVCQVGVGALRS